MAEKEKQTQQVSAEGSRRRKGFFKRSFRRLSRRLGRSAGTQSSEAAERDQTAESDIREIVSVQCSNSCEISPNTFTDFTDNPSSSQSCASDSVLCRSRRNAFVRIRRKLSSSFRHPRQSSEFGKSCVSTEMEFDPSFDSDVSRLTRFSSSGSVFGAASVDGAMDDLNSRHTPPKMHWDCDDDFDVTSKARDNSFTYESQYNQTGLESPIPATFARRQQHQQQQQQELQPHAERDNPWHQPLPDLRQEQREQSPVGKQRHPRKSSLQEKEKQQLQREQPSKRHRWRLIGVTELNLSVKQEYAYCQTLEAVCNPLGVPDTREGHSPSELAAHVQEIFNIDNETHQRCLRAVQSSKPVNVSLCVTVEEARDLRPFNPNGICDPYCVIQLKSQARNSTPRTSPQESPKSQRRSTPRTSPTQTRRHSSVRIDGQFGFKETHTIRGSTKPHWNTEFEIPVTDIHSDELFVSIWDESINSSDTESIHKSVLRTRHSLRNIFRHFHKVSGDKLDGCLGQFKVPVKDIPVLGTEHWYDLYEDSKYKKRTQGQIKLKLQLTARPSTENAESDQCSSEDFLYVVQRVYRHAMDELAQQFDPRNSSDERPVFEELPLHSKLVLAHFAAQNHFSTMSQMILELSVLLEDYCDSQCPCIISDKLIRDVIARADTLWTNKQLQDRCHEIQGISAQKELFNKTEVELLGQRTAHYLDQIAERLYHESTFPKTFPPIEINIDELKRELGFSKPLLCLCHKLNNTNMNSRLTELLKERIQADCQIWWNLKLQCIKSVDRDAVISETKIFTGVVREAVEHCLPCDEVSQSFIEFNINYEKTVITFLEKKIASKAQEVMLRIDSYQKKLSRYRSNILNSSISSQSLFAALRKFVVITRSHFTTRDLFRITIVNYQEWFRQAVTYWLQTFREEGIRRVVKALDIEKDVVQVTEGVKISNSAVDVVANLHKICMEWKEINFNDADIALLGATKITELICDGITRYLEKIEHILEHNGYYDFIDNCQFDVTDQLCITLNNIVHVIHYIQKLPELLEWDKVCQNMGLKYEDQAVADRCHTTLERLVRTTREELISRARSLWNKVMDLMAIDLEMYIKKFTQCHPSKISSVDGLLDYLKTNLAVLHKKLDQFIVPAVVEVLWNKTVAIFTDTLMSSQHPDYYKQMHNHLESLFAYFEEVGLKSYVRECENYCQLIDTLTLHQTPTTELILQYYHSLNNSAVSPAAYYGHLEVKIGYKIDSSARVGSTMKVVVEQKSLDEPDATENKNKEDEDKVVNVFVNVLRAKKLPTMSEKEELCNPFISLALCPMVFFPINRDLRTPTVKGTVDPVFDISYQYQGIPLSLLKQNGTTLILTVWHSEDILPCNHFLGEVVIPLNSIPELGSLQCIEDIPATICHLTWPVEPTEESFKVLLERQSFDKVARDMVTRRKRDTGMTTAWPLCKPVNYILQLIRGGQSTKVKGRPTLSALVL